MPINSDEIWPPTILSTTEIKLKDIVMILNWSKIFHKLIQLKDTKDKIQMIDFWKKYYCYFLGLFCIKSLNCSKVS